MRTRKNKPPSRAAAKGANAQTPKPSKRAVQAVPPFEGSASHLLHRAEQSATDIFSRIAPAGLLTPRQYAILAAIEANQGLSQTGLVENTGIDRSTLADIVRRMLDKGLIQRERTADDARAYAVRLTRKGTNTLKKMRPYADEVDRRIVDAIPEAQQELFLSLLQHLVQTLATPKNPAA
jgi:MarR family transcriptional regulator, temperature-dependent positive regulator of motility